MPDPSKIRQWIIGLGRSVYLRSGSDYKHHADGTTVCLASDVEALKAENARLREQVRGMGSELSRQAQWYEESAE